MVSNNHVWHRANRNGYRDGAAKTGPVFGRKVNQ